MQWDVPVGPMSPLVTFTVENTGHVPVAVGLVSTTDPAFRITQDSCSRTRLAPSDLCHVTVQFQASTPGHHDGALVVPDDTGAPPHRQSLSGEAR
jgi:HYDIN/CFA65/VesB-like, Ig-like domain